MKTLVQAGAQAEVQLRQHPLQMFFAPETVAVFGATEEAGSVGRAVMANLIRYPFGGTIFPIHADKVGILGVKAYPNLQALPMDVDLALVMAAAEQVPEILGDCVQAGVKAAILMSPSFQESGADRLGLERRLQEQLRGSSLRILGPGSRGLACSFSGLNATFAPAMVRAGTVGLLTQSAALLTPLLHNDMCSRVGCSAFISVGSMLDLAWADWLDFLADDPHTESIGIYLETLGDAPAFLQALRRVAPHKPVIVVKGGQGEALGRHDEVMAEAFRSHGALQVKTIDELFRLAYLLTTQPRVAGRRLTILSNTGGTALLATEAVLDDGSELTTLAPETMTALEALLPAGWSRGNPIDVAEDIGPARFAQAAELAARDPNADALQVIFKTQGSLHPTQVAEELAAVAQSIGKPILASWMWGAASSASLAILQDAGIAVFPTPGMAVHAFGYLWRHAENLGSLTEAPVAIHCGGGACDGLGAKKLVAEALRAGRTTLGELECQQLFEAYGLPIGPMRVAVTEAEAVEFAGRLGYPVVLKFHLEMPLEKGKTIRLQLPAANPASLRRLFRTLRLLARDAGARQFQGVRLQPFVPQTSCEFVLAGLTDPQLGPVVQLSLDGHGAALAHDRLVLLPPLTPTRLRRLFAQAQTILGLPTCCAQLAWPALEDFLVRFSTLVAEQPGIKEIVINPLLAFADGLLALEARVELTKKGE